MKLFQRLLVAPAALGLFSPLAANATEVNLNDISNYSDVESIDFTNSFDNDKSTKSPLLAGGEGLVDTDSYDGGFSETTTASFSADFAIGAVDGSGISSGVTEGTEQVIVEVRDASNSNVVASTPAITINDTSYVGKNHIGKTFGPINVNRDNGATSNASDWYTICGLDSLPDGSKIAIFIDTSGSMTMQTVQASYDQLIAKLQARSMDVITVQNSQEDWITPFDQILN